jgi:drug/metabolite transporter (DMT)-like permease
LPEEIRIIFGTFAVVAPTASIYPLFTVLLGRFALKEKLELLQYGAIMAGVLGIFLLAM